MKIFLPLILLITITVAGAQSDTATTLTHNETAPWLPAVLIVVAVVLIYGLVRRGRR
ncbi:hypothetical protein BN8_03219 [Fibrisoma limi BUZ 3]|uniref:Uncharacterized protein n=1 Tax=Fibrisoma limi BUZ 3 TaxID=1185876 RepID=I2GJK2_9BACT|nr:hypothetical protein [Fibrisoma limi]CCH54077.1 hypothetical protein BN8_03219 [Fibrisoma limi BUZ 3]